MLLYYIYGLAIGLLIGIMLLKNRNSLFSKR